MFEQIIEDIDFLGWQSVFNTIAICLTDIAFIIYALSNRKHYGK